MNQQSQAPRILLISASALTKLHPGAGRSPGVVDLPVVRDPLGYPFIPGSMVKGPLRTLAKRKTKNKKEAKEGENNKNIVNCLFGPKVTEESKHAGALAFTDLYPLLVPAASPEHGVVYVTSPSLLSRATALLEEANTGKFKKLIESLENLASAAREKSIFTGTPVNGKVTAGSIELEAVKKDPPEGLNELYNGLHPLYISLPPESRLLVVSEDQAVLTIEAQLLRLTRVRLNPDTKTVETGGLWTEEYLPWGTLFLGAIIDTGFRSNNCPTDTPLRTLENTLGSTFSFVVGGKETVGSGLLKTKFIKPGGGK